MLHRRAVLMGALALTAATSACASRGESPFGAAPAGSEEVLLTVQNQDFRDATIYAYWNGSRDRLGMVVGKTTETFAMRWRAEEIQLEIDFVGGGGYRTESIDVWRGDHLNFTIFPRG